MLASAKNLEDKFLAIAVLFADKEKHCWQMGNATDSALDRDKYLMVETVYAKDHSDKYRENATKSAQ